MAKNIKMGVIGCGQFMSQQHIQTINRSKFLTLQHLADRAREKVECIARKYNAARYSTDWGSEVRTVEGGGAQPQNRRGRGRIRWNRNFHARRLCAVRKASEKEPARSPAVK